MARVSELLETDNHIIRPYFRFANHAKFFETRFLFIETLFAMFDLWKLYSNSYTASLNEVLITTCLIEPAMLSCFTVRTNIDYSFPLSLLLQQETLLAVPRCTNPGYEALPKRRVTVKEEVLQWFAVPEFSALSTVISRMQPKTL